MPMQILCTEHASKRSHVLSLGYAARRVAAFRTGRRTGPDFTAEILNVLEEFHFDWVIRTGFATYRVYRESVHRCPCCGDVGPHEVEEVLETANIP